MRLKNYMLETIDYKNRTRGKEISLDKIKKILSQYSDGISALYNNSNAIIMTRNTKILVDYQILNPKTKIPRKSANTFNYYTLIIDNSKKWKKYPKRSQSIICLTDKRNIMLDYSYWVIPKNGAKIGQAPKNDMWFSFDSKFLLNDLNEGIRFLLNSPYFIKKFKYTNDEDYYIFDKSIKLKRFDSSLLEFKKATLFFDKWLKNQNLISLDDLKRKLSNNFFNNWKGEPLYDYLYNLLDPKKFGFKIVDITKLEYDKEVWTDSESLIVNYKNINKIIYTYKEKYKL